MAKPTLNHGYIQGSAETAAYIAELLFQYPVLDVHMMSGPEHGPWFVYFSLVGSHTLASGGGVVSSGGGKFDFGIYNVTLMHRFSIGDSAPTIEKITHPNRLGEDDRKAWNTFLMQLSRELHKLAQAGKTQAVNRAPVADAPVIPGRIKLRIGVRE